jgi:hypothetical protein
MKASECKKSVLSPKKCVTEDERRQVVKGHTDSSSLLLCTTFLPARRTKLSAFWKALKGHSPIVCRLHVNSITPPFLNAVQANRAIFRVLQSKEDDEDADSITCVQSNRQHIYSNPHREPRPIARQKKKPSDSLITKRLTVVLCPPVKVASTDDIIKDKADKNPGHVVKGGRRRYVGRAAEGDWEINVLEETYSKLLVQYPLEQWCKDAGKEEEEEAIVELTPRK